jgi:aldose 1-epimerase
MKELRTILLENNHGMSVEILNYGARIKSILFPANGIVKDMTVGYPASKSYLTDDFYLGATCGRVCNRIENGIFDIDGIRYSLSQNDSEHCLHGGVANFSYKFWQIESLSHSTVILTLQSKDGDQGFPGQLNLQVKYHLTDSNKLEIEYFAVSNKATPINITNHAYFNLGDDSCETLELTIAASNMLERKNNGLPSGKTLPVVNSDFNFTKPVNLGERRANATDVNVNAMGCFDHCYVLNNINFDIPKAMLISKNNQIKMSLFTDQPAIQLYTGVGLSGEFNPYQGVCLEAQNYSNAVNIDHFPNSILQPYDEYRRKIIYQFESMNKEQI